MAMLVGSLLISLLFVFFLEVRKRIGVYSRNCLPLCTTCLWISIILPLGVGAPVAVVYLGNTSDDFRYLSGVIISFASVLLMIGVSIGSIVLSYVFKQMELESRATYCVKYMKAQLSKIAVRANEDLLRILFDQHQLNGEQILTETLLRKIFAFWWPVQDSDPDIYHNKVLIESERFKALEEQMVTQGKQKIDFSAEKSGDEKEPEPKRKSRFCCFCCYDSDDEDSAAVSGSTTSPMSPPHGGRRRQSRALAELIKRPAPVSSSIIDFKYVLARLGRGGDDPVGDNNSLFGSVYVEPYNAVGVGGTYSILMEFAHRLHCCCRW